MKATSAWLCFISALISPLVLSAQEASQPKHNVSPPHTSRKVPTASSRCKEPDPIKLESVANYVAARFHVGTDTHLKLVSNTTGEDCFLKLEYELAPSRRAMTFYLTPDGNYLIPALYDLRIDPVAEERAQFRTINSELTSGLSPYRGASTAPVNIVEFADFQCPYCKRLTEMLEPELKSTGASNIHFVFKEFPLPMHPWAKLAAQVAECANMQSVEAFWKVHDFLFENQKIITSENLRVKLNDVLEGEVNRTEFNACVDKNSSSGSVQNDIVLGQKYGVRATPTLFVNGVRFEGMRSAAELHAIIDAAARGEVPTPQMTAGTRPVQAPQGQQCGTPPSPTNTRPQLQAQ
jgi:protein-disulfide isomerase